MNAQFPVGEFADSRAINLPMFGQHRAQQHDFGRWIAGGATLLLHVVLLAAVLFGGRAVIRVAQPQAMMVNIFTDHAEQAPAPQFQPHLQRADMPVVQAPEIAIAAPPAQHAIQVTAAQAQAAPAAPGANARADYLASILAQLNRYKQYPPSARRARIQGVVMLHFVMDRSGNVQTADINKKSGYPILDQEALALIRRAQPLPPMPANFRQSHLDLVVPIEFFLR